CSLRSYSGYALGADHGLDPW
nr:immunoglobulin heavy chain junction region [Macaca mulatta]MOV56617.1 immunoglobulin heavy chain junction region [Macaca mulatta]MOV57749.1 immunoglobulin heavy chain junction region [Macaca mulatta]MOV59086.1 immunoglobulin heavy chain junction region [Macaca mulatta]